MSGGLDRESFWKNLSAPEQGYKFAEMLTRAPAAELISRSGILDIPAGTPLRVFDNACGTGIVTEVLMEEFEKKFGKGDGMEGVDLEIVAGDVSPPMIEYLKAKVVANGWEGKVKVELIDVMDTGLPSDHFTHIFCNFRYSSMINPQAALRDSLRTLRPDGVLAFSTWETVGYIPFTDEALHSFGAPSFTPPPSLPTWKEISFILSQLEEACASTSSVLETPTADIFPFKVRIPSVQTYLDGMETFQNKFTIKMFKEEDQDWIARELPPALKKLLEGRYGVDQEWDLDNAAVLVQAVKKE